MPPGFRVPCPEGSRADSSPAVARTAPTRKPEQFQRSTVRFAVPLKPILLAGAGRIATWLRHPSGMVVDRPTGPPVPPVRLTRPCREGPHGSGPDEQRIGAGGNGSSPNAVSIWPRPLTARSPSGRVRANGRARRYYDVGVVKRSREPCNLSMTRSARGCYPCLRYEVLPMSPGRTAGYLVPQEGFEPPTPSLRNSR